MAGERGAGPPFLARVCPGAPSPPGSLLAGPGWWLMRTFPLVSAPSSFLLPPNPYLLVSTSTPFPHPLDTPSPSPFLVSLLPVPSLSVTPALTPRPPADHLQQPGCHQDRGRDPGHAPSRARCPASTTTGSRCWRWPQRRLACGPGPPAPGGGEGPSLLLCDGDHGHHPAGRPWPPPSWRPPPPWRPPPRAGAAPHAEDSTAQGEEPPRVKARNAGCRARGGADVRLAAPAPGSSEGPAV